MLLQEITVRAIRGDEAEVTRLATDDFCSKFNEEVAEIQKRYEAHGFKGEVPFELKAKYGTTGRITIFFTADDKQKNPLAKLGGSEEMQKKLAARMDKNKRSSFLDKELKRVWSSLVEGLKKYGFTEFQYGVGWTGETEKPDVSKPPSFSAIIFAYKPE